MTPRGRVAALVALCLWAAPVVVNAATLRVAVPELPNQFDPQLAASETDLAVAAETFVGLATRDAQGKTVPGVAQWQITPDGLVYTFTLRLDLRWSDNRDLTAQDFVAAFARAVDPATAAPFAGALDPILNVAAPDARTVKITLKQRSAHFIDALALPIAAPIPHHALKQWGEAWATPVHFAGNGFLRPDPAGEGALIRNIRYFERNPAPDRVEFIADASAAAALADVRAGRAALALGFPDLLDGRAAMSDLKPEPGQDLAFVAVNMRKKPLDRRENRHALAMVIDRDALLKELHIPGAVLAFTFAPSPLFGTAVVPRAAYATLTPRYRDAIAEVLLAEAGIDPAHPVTLTLLHPADAISAATAKTLVAAWAKIGFTVRAEARDSAAYAAALRAGDYDLAIARWPTRDTSSPWGALAPLLARAGPWNYPGYAEPEFEKHMADAEREDDAQRRLNALADAEGAAVEDQPVLPLFFFTLLAAVHDVAGWVPNAAGVHPLHLLSP